LPHFRDLFLLRRRTKRVAADWKAIVTWEVTAQECDIPIGEAALEKTIPEAVTAV
jgi:hypothetical protein